MLRGTTPTITYTFPFEADTISKIQMCFIQGGDTLLVKDEDDCTFDGYTVSVTLTEAETYLFSAQLKLEVRCRFLFDTGKVGGTAPMTFTVEETGRPEKILSDD